VPLITTAGGNVAGPLFLLGSGGATWNALYDMADLSASTAGTNYTGWSDPAGSRGWDRLAPRPTRPRSARSSTRCSRCSTTTAPWLMMYFQPDFYGVSNRINWEARRDEKVSSSEPTLR
jgi:peptide/nickel transport system substrate-binding protein